MSDINDNAPEFAAESYNIRVSEGLSIEMPILNLLAIDDDFGSNAEVVYSIVSQEPVPGEYILTHEEGIPCYSYAMHCQCQCTVLLHHPTVLPFDFHPCRRFCY